MSKEIDIEASTENAMDLSEDPAYLRWYDAKVRAALKASLEHPEDSIPQAEVWKRFGLED